MSRSRRDSRFSRRTMLKGAAGVAALSSLRPSWTWAAEEDVYDCIVLGAGISGVTAARDLHEAGFRVLVVEGSQRIGGRMYTQRDFIRHPRHRDDPARFPLEVGAEFIHIGKKSRYPEFFDELHRHGFTRRKYPKIKHNRLAFPDWHKNPKKLLLSLLRNTNLLPTVTLLSEIDDYDRSEDMPIGEFVGTRGYQGKGLRLGRYTVSSHTPGQLYDPAIDKFHPLGSGSIPSCAVQPGPVDTISVAGFRSDRLPDQLFDEQSEYKILRNGELCGYDALPAAIANQVTDPSVNPNGVPGEILLGHRVTRVRRRSGDPVGGLAITVETDGGGTRELLARSAVSTFSAGVLNPTGGPGVQIFGDLLTDAKREALHSVRYGPITKFSLEFQKRHWGCKGQMTVLSHPTGCARTFFSSFPGRRGPHVLTGLLMNQDHRILRELDDAAAVDHLLAVLQSVLAPRKRKWVAEEVLVLRDDGTPNFFRQDWEADPFALGGNSYLAFRPEVGSAGVAGMRQILRDPSETLPLFWAGEATAPAYNWQYQPLSVHGAYISGVGVARDVRAFLEGGAGAMDAPGAADGAAAPALTDEAPASALSLPLRARDVELLEAYARERPEEELGAIAREVCMMGVYLQTQDPERLGDDRPSDSRVEKLLEVSFPVSDVQRIQEQAQEAGLSPETAALALLRRGLQAVRRSR